MGKAASEVTKSTFAFVSGHPEYEKAEVYQNYTKKDLPFRTTWPLQVGFPGAIIPNLNEYLSLFSNCLVSVQNFQGIDLHEWNYPIHLSRFDIAGIYEYPIYSHIVYHDTSKRYFFEKVPRNLSQITPYEQRKSSTAKDFFKFKWTCYAQFDLFHPEIKDAFHFYLHKMVYKKKEEFILSPMVERRYQYVSVLTSDVPLIFGENSRQTFFVLVTNLNTSLETKDFWLSCKLDLGFEQYSPRMFYVFTENFKEISPIRNQQLKVESFNFVCLSCCACKKVIIPIKINNWEKSVKQIVKVQQVPWAVDQPRDAPSKNLLGFLDEKNREDALRKYIAFTQNNTYIPDKSMATTILWNASFFVKFSLEDEEKLANHTCSVFFMGKVELLTSYLPGERPGKVFYIFPQLYLRRQEQIAVVRSEDEYTFLSCGAPKREKASIAGLYSSFDLTTWVCLIAFIFIWPVTLSLIEKDLNLRHVLIDSQTWLLGFILLLEQGHYLATNSNKRGPLYYTCGLTLLVLIVVSNAYKGDNIQSLTKLLQPIPYTNFKQLVAAGFKLFSPMVINVLSWYYYENVTEFYEESKAYGWQISLEKLNNVSSALEFHPLAKDIIYRKTNFTYLNILNECEDVALFGWKVEQLQPIYDSLYEKKAHEGKVFLGTEIFFKKQIGWTIKGWTDEDLPLRISYLRDSGIIDEWQTITERKYPAAQLQPFKLNLKGNVIVQFYCLAAGLAVSLLVFLVEFRKRVFKGVFTAIEKIWKTLFIIFRNIRFQNCKLRVKVFV